MATQTIPNPEETKGDSNAGTTFLPAVNVIKNIQAETQPHIMKLTSFGHMFAASLLGTGFVAVCKNGSVGVLQLLDNNNPCAVIECHTTFVNNQ